MQNGDGSSSVSFRRFYSSTAVHMSGKRPQIAGEITANHVCSRYLGIISVGGSRTVSLVVRCGQAREGTTLVYASGDPCRCAPL